MFAFFVLLHADDLQREAALFIVCAAGGRVSTGICSPRRLMFLCASKNDLFGEI